MSGISRVDKYIVEMMGLQSMKEAEPLRSVPINIVLGADRTGKTGIMGLAAMGLAIRCFKGPIRIHLPGGDVASLPCQKSSIEDFIKEEAARADAANRIEFLSGNPDNYPTISVGCEIKGAYVADCAGWRAFIGGAAPGDLAALPVAAPAAVFAIACVFSKLFAAHVLGNQKYGREHWQFSLLSFNYEDANDYQVETQKIDLGEISLLGAGAIGSGFAFTLWMSEFEADLLILDRDRYEEPNFETSMLISKTDELKMALKAECLASHLAIRKGIIIEPVRENVNKESPSLHKKRDVLVCGVDNSETRRELDGANVEVILNGGIGGGKKDAGHILFSRHAREDLFLSQLYPEIVNETTADSQVAPAEFKENCSRIPYLDATMAAPFLGLATGALLVAGCAQRAMAVKSDGNYLKMDMLKLQKNYRKENKRRNLA